MKKKDTKAPDHAERKVAKRFSPRVLKLSAKIRRAIELHPRRINLEHFKKNQIYRLATMIYGKDHVNLADIPAVVLVEIIMRALDQVNFKCEQLRAPKKVLNDALFDEFSEDSQLDLPEGVSREKVGVYTCFHPREFNPVIQPTVIPGLEAYVDMMVVITDTGFYLWLPFGKRLIEMTPEILMSIFEKDRFVAWFLLCGIRQFVGSLVNEANRQLWLVTPLQDEINNVLKHISLR